MSDCPQLQNGVCKVASSMAGSHVQAQAAACAACTNHKQPRTINKITVGMALAELLRLGKDARNLMGSHGHHINERPTLPLRVLSYATAVAKWLAQGRPVRTQEQVSQLYHEQCGKCDRREPTSQPEVSYCGPCGCVLSEDPSVTNKLYFLTEHCPLGKF
jgi:hypothetical protein